jgi:hypothetical protein
MTEPSIIFTWVPPDMLDDYLAQGWRLCAGWRNAEHHLRYLVPMERDVEGDGDAGEKTIR